MVAVGIWAAQLGGRMIWRLPLTFVVCMLLGGALARLPVPEAFVELGIALSVVVLGAFVMRAAARIPALLAMTIVGTFALCHGFAHGAEMRAEYSPLSYGIGFIVSTAALHAAGVLLCVALCKTEFGALLIRLSGAGAVACGAMLLVVVL
jgi:urease accessory protein